MSNILKYLGVFVLSFIVSIFIFMKKLDDIIINISSSSIVFISGRIVLAVLISVIIISIMNKTINHLQLDILSIIYILFVLSLTFFKGDNNSVVGINMNPLQIINDLNMSYNTSLLILGNLLCYIPIGIYLRYKLKTLSNLYLTIYFIVFNTLIELVQYMLRYGSFDIDDIIINTTGFLLGLTVYKIVKQYVKINPLSL
jgi:glycopeptide antibiotics resistance protein